MSISRLAGAVGAAVVAAGLSLVAVPVTAQAATQPTIAAGGIRIVQPGTLGDRFTGSVPVVLSQPAPAAVSFTWTFTADPTRESDSIVPASGTGSIARGRSWPSSASRW